MSPNSKSMPPPDSAADATLSVPVSADCSVEDCERQIRRILDSPIIAGSKRLCEFISFSTRAAMDGRLEMDQYEVAAGVLHRSDDFNPLDDASVRKLASLVRARLEKYYQELGSTDPILVSLPRRSYVLRFRVNEAVVPASSGASPAAVPEREREESSSPPLAHSPTPVESSADSTVTAPPQSEDSINGVPRAQPDGRTGDASVPASQGSRRTNPRTKWTAGLAISAILAGIAIYQGSLSLWTRPSATATSSADTEADEFRIVSRMGDMRGNGDEFSPGSVLMGPAMDMDGDATVRMQFLPESAAQHGGLIVAQDADNYVRFGSHFKVRSMLEFGHEVNGVYSMPESSYQFDPLGQSGLPLWLSIRKQGANFTAFSSHDGQHWERFDSMQSLGRALTNPVAGIYALNGLTNSREVTARFRDLGVGLRFHHRANGPVNAKDFPGWSVSAGCKETDLLSVRGEALEFRFPDDKLCSHEFERAWEAPAGQPWYIEAYLDFQAINGSSAGIVVKTEKGRVRLVRRDLNGGSIMLERDVDRDARMPDFPGAPPIYLRLTAQDGYLTGGFSRDGRNYETIPARIPLAELGPIRGYGLEAALSHWLPIGRRPPARLISIEQGVLALKPLPSSAALKETAKGVPVSAR